MDAVEFLKAYRRIYGSNVCTKCPLWVDEHYFYMMDGKIVEGVRLDDSAIIAKNRTMGGKTICKDEAERVSKEVPERTIVQWRCWR